MRKARDSRGTGRVVAMIEDSIGFGCPACFDDVFSELEWQLLEAGDVQRTRPALRPPR